MAESAKLAAPRYAFGEFVLERAQQEGRRRDGSALNLSPRLFNALLLFVEHAGELLDKDALMRALWPGLVVDENSLSQVVSALRRALADDPVAGRYIQTVPRRGFRFVAAVTSLPEQTTTSTAAPQATEESRQRDAIPVSDVRAATASAGVTTTRPVGPHVSTGRRWLRLGLIGGAATSLGAAGLWALRRAPRSDAASVPSTLAVLP